MTRQSSFQNRAALLVSATYFVTSPVLAVPPNLDGTNSPDEMVRAYSEPIPGVDWDEMSPHFVQMLDRMFERNGWDEEADDYARKVASRIAAIPPWDMTARFAALTDEVAQRYGLTPQQAANFQRSVLRESASMLFKHGPTMWKQAQEALQGRAQGKPYTAEQIARWVKEADPLMGEIEKSADRIAEELARTLPEEKKSVLEKDMAGFYKRQKAVETMSKRWAKGLWKPDEWGLEDDPIQYAGTLKAAQQTAPEPAPVPVPLTPRPVAPLVAPAVAVTPIPDHWVEHDPTTWIAFVIDVRKRFRLDAGQMDTAWSIHAELVERASRFTKLRTEELTAVPVAQRPTHEAYRPVRELFVELRDRLESLPTSAQREAGRK